MLTPSEIIAEIDGGNPVVTDISPFGFSFGGASMHVALIIGYEGDERDLSLIVNDPFPYLIEQFQGRPDPFLQAGGKQTDPGQYMVRYRPFISRLVWRDSITNIRCKGRDCPNREGDTTQPSEVESIASKVVEKLAEEDFESVRDDFNDYLSNRLSAQQIEAAWTFFTRRLGPFEKQGAITRTREQGS